MTIAAGAHLDIMARLDALRDAVESAQKTLSVQFGWEFTLAGMPAQPDPSQCDYGSTIALTGDGTRYTYAVVCNRSSASAFARAFFDLDQDEDPDLADLADAINELPNVAAGVWKARREKHGESYQLGLPIFMRGNSWLQYFSKGVNAIAQTLQDPEGHSLQVVLIWQSGECTEGSTAMTTETILPVDPSLALPIRVLQEAVEATITTCAVQMQLALTVADDPGDPRDAQVDFGSTIALTTERGGGWNLAVMGDRTSCDAITRVLFAMDEDESPELEDLADGLGEIANVAAGVLKAKRLEAGERVQLGLPLFMEGRGCIDFFASGLQGIAQSLRGPDGIAIHVILIWQEG